MGVLKKFEQRLEGLVNGTFAKVFKSEVQPVEIAGALQRECDNNATIWNRDRTVVPNDFIVELSTPDHERLSPYSGQLGDELAGMVRDYAKQQRYTFMGPIKVTLQKAEDLDTGLYRVRSRTLASSSDQQQAPQSGAQGGYGYPPPGHARGRTPDALRAARAPWRPARRLRLPAALLAGVLERTAERRAHAPLDRDQRHPPPDLASDAGAGPQHRGRRADRRPRRLPPALRDPDRNALDDPGSRIHQRHRGGRTAHHPRYAPRRLADRRGQHHHHLPASRRVKRGQCQS
ncbi:hypothetical protein QFZ74_003141 [Streptomyces sp. V3I7]|nr:hypothetical protein [Streptomyces sp. V3I7]